MFLHFELGNLKMKHVSLSQFIKGSSKAGAPYSKTDLLNWLKISFVFLAHFIFMVKTRFK